MKQVIILNGSGGCGKDTFVKFISEVISVYKTSIVDGTKEIAGIMGWHGGKSDEDRKFLADVMSAWDEYNDRPYKDVYDEYKRFISNQINTELMFIDMRQPMHISRAKTGMNALTVLIRNPNVEKIDSNQADASVEDFEYDLIIENDGGLNDLQNSAIEFVHYLRDKTKDSKLCTKNSIDDSCISCDTIGVDENGKYCDKTKQKEAVLSNIDKALRGYTKTDIVPISGALLYDICMILKGEITI